MCKLKQKYNSIYFLILQVINIEKIIFVLICRRHLIWISFSQEQIKIEKFYFNRIYSVKFSALQMQADSEK